MEILNRFHFHLLHPKLIHFPIALFISAMGLELLSLFSKNEKLHWTAIHIYILATLVTPLVVITGLQDANHLNLHHPVLTIHEKYGHLTMWTSLASLPILWLVNRQSPKVMKVIFMLLLLVIATFVTITGHNGGRMVYEYSVGVEE